MKRGVQMSMNLIVSLIIVIAILGTGMIAFTSLLDATQRQTNAIEGTVSHGIQENLVSVERPDREASQGESVDYRIHVSNPADSEKTFQVNLLQPSDSTGQPFEDFDPVAETVLMDESFTVPPNSTYRTLLRFDTSKLSTGNHEFVVSVKDSGQGTQHGDHVPLYLTVT